MRIRDEVRVAGYNVEFRAECGAEFRWNALFLRWIFAAARLSVCIAAWRYGSGPPLAAAITNFTVYEPGAGPPCARRCREGSGRAVGEGR